MLFRIKWLSGLLRCSRNDALGLVLRSLLLFEPLLAFAMAREEKLSDLKSSIQENEVCSSLFFTAKEIGAMPKVPHTPLQAARPSLSGILYYDARHWAVWVNGQVIHPENAHELKGFRIEKVTPQGVEFSRLSSEGEVLENFTNHLSHKGRGKGS